MVPLDNLYWSWAISLVITLIIYLLFLLFIKYWRMRSHAQQLLTLANETLEKQVKEAYICPGIDQSKINTGDKRAQSG